jgi:hypothetical protein
MWRQRFGRVTYITSVLPLPSLALALLLAALNSVVDTYILRLLTTLFLWILAASYSASLLLGLAYGLVHRTPWVLAASLAAMLDIGLFILVLPEGETQVGWRTIDVLLLGGLLILSIVQVIALRKHRGIE